jgi:UV DNA damage endonuclease
MLLGYACINKTLSDAHAKTKEYCVNRTCRKATFEEKGLAYVSGLALSNVSAMEKILHWNEQEGIRFYRMSSDMIPWHSEYELLDLPDHEAIIDTLARCGEFAKQHNHRITYHPSPFVKIASPRGNVQDNSVAELERHSQIMDLMGLDNSHQAKINIHIGAVYGSKEETAKMAFEGIKKLSLGVVSRLTFENDDKGSLWSVKDLYELVYPLTKTPIVFDFHHHSLLTGGLGEQEALEMALDTWPDSIVPVTHYSQSRCVEHNDTKIKPQAHSDSYWSAPKTYGHNFDIMCECKHKEQGLQKLRELL